jgi:hypothetical protein
MFWVLSIYHAGGRWIVGRTSVIKVIATILDH